MTLLAFVILALLTISGYVLNRRAAVAIRGGGERLHSLSHFHGMFSALFVIVPLLIVVILWLLFQGPVVDAVVMGGLSADATIGLDESDLRLVLSELHQIAAGRVFGTPEQWKLDAAERLVSLNDMARLWMVIFTAAVGVLIVVTARSRVRAEFRARQAVERIVSGLMIACSLVAILTTIGIVLALIFEAYRFFQMVPIAEFLFGVNWEPQIPIREDQIAAEGAFGWLPVILGTVVVSTVALFVAAPVGLMSAIYFNEFAPKRLRAVAKPFLEILAGVPTVVYGFFAILVVAPAIRSFGQSIGLDVAPNTALAAGGVMGIMLIPFISSFADDALSAVPQSLRDGSLALGATRGETMLKVLFPAAIPGIVGGVLLAVSRAIGETMIVVMAAGLIARMTINPLDSVTTVTVQIVTLLIGDTAFDNPKTLAAFALGLMLFIVTLLINMLALRIVHKYREIYD